MWNEDDARKRLQKSYNDAKDLELKPLTKEMNLENLSPTKCRIVTGVQLYLDVVNIQEHLDEAGDDKQKLSRLLRHVHIYERLLTNLLYEMHGAEKVHFQGTRLHAVIYKPYDTSDVKDPAVKRLTSARDFVAQAKELAALIADETGFTFKLEAGIESGDAIATMNGQDGSRELLFIGECANVAAKKLTGKAGTRYGPNALPLVASLPAAPTLPSKWEKAVTEEVANNPLSQFELFEPQERIDYEKLGVRTAKLDGASFFADLSGFTKLVANAATDAAKRELLQCLHAVRSEMRYVVRTDCGGDHVQYQGDRIQGVFYDAASSSRFVSKAAESALAMQSVMRLCREMFSTLADVGMTVGIDFGRALITQLGIRGNRDIIVLGRSVPAASDLQDSSSPGETSISATVFANLEDDLAALFKQHDEDDDVYVSTADAEGLGARQDAAAYTGKVELVGSASSGVRVVASSSSAAVQPVRSYLRRP
jgi:class 3 adenylate cyclase